MQHRDLGRDSMFAGLFLAGKRFIDLSAPERADAGSMVCDVGYCSSALPADAPALTDVLGRIGEMFLLRVPPDGDWCADVERLALIMPHWALLPAMDSTGHIAGRTPRLLIFSRDQGCIAVTTVGRGEALTTGDAAVRWMDLPASGRTSQLMGNVPTTQLLFADLRQQLSSPAAVYPGDVLRIIKTNLPMMALACRGAPEALVDLGTDRYWWRFLEGLASYIESGRLTPENAYVQYLRSISAHGGYDPGMRFDLADASRAVARLRPRLAAFLEALTSRALKRPLLVYNPVGLSLLSPLGYSTDDSKRHQHMRLRGGSEFRVQCVDGNHRLAALWLGGAAACPVVPMWTNVVGADPGLESLIKPARGKSSGLNSLFRQTVQEWDLDATPVDPPSTFCVGPTMVIVKAPGSPHLARKRYRADAFNVGIRRRAYEFVHHPVTPVMAGRVFPLVRVMQREHATGLEPGLPGEIGRARALWGLITVHENEIDGSPPRSAVSPTPERGGGCLLYRFGRSPAVTPDRRAGWLLHRELF